MYNKELTFGNAEAQLFLLPRGEGGLQRLGHFLVGAGRERRHLRWDVCNNKIITILHNVFNTNEQSRLQKMLNGANVKL